MEIFIGHIQVEVEGKDVLDAREKLAKFAERAVERCEGLPGKNFTVTVENSHQERNGRVYRDQNGA